jgi:hypothetical protein
MKMGRESMRPHMRKHLGSVAGKMTDEEMDAMMDQVDRPGLFSTLATLREFCQSINIDSGIKLAHPASLPWRAAV